MCRIIPSSKSAHFPLYSYHYLRQLFPLRHASFLERLNGPFGLVLESQFLPKHLFVGQKHLTLWSLSISFLCKRRKFVLRLNQQNIAVWNYFSPTSNRWYNIEWSRFLRRVIKDVSSSDDGHMAISFFCFTEQQFVDIFHFRILLRVFCPL